MTSKYIIYIGFYHFHEINLYWRGPWNIVLQLKGYKNLWATELERVNHELSSLVFMSVQFNILYSTLNNRYCQKQTLQKCLCRFRSLSKPEATVSRKYSPRPHEKIFFERNQTQTGTRDRGIINLQQSYMLYVVYDHCNCIVNKGPGINTGQCLWLQQEFLLTKLKYAGHTGLSTEGSIRLGHNSVQNSSSWCSKVMEH